MKPIDRRFLKDVHVSDDRVEAWLLAAKAGDTQSLARLRRWVYGTARHYFAIRARREGYIAEYDAEEMASQFFVEFDSAWPRIRSATRYTRYLLATWVARYLRTKRRLRGRELLIDADAPVTDDASNSPWRTWDDASWLRYRILLETFADVDQHTQLVVVGRMSTPPRPYRELASELHTTETALRMRMTRFHRAVRRAYGRAVGEDQGKVRRLPPLREIPRIEEIIPPAIDGDTNTQ